MKNETKFDTWCIVDIMGHQRLAGRVTEETIGGASLLRCDVPAVDGVPAWTTYFTAGSIYQMTPVSEDLARMTAERLGKQPISIYDLPQEWRDKIQARPAALPAPKGDGDGWYDDDEECPI